VAHLFPQSQLLCPPRPFFKVATHFLTGCPPLLIVRLACYRPKLRVCHAFCSPLQNSLHFIYATFVRILPSAATFRLVNFLQHTNRALHSTGKPNELQSTVSLLPPPKNHAKPLCFQHRSFPPRSIGAFHIPLGANSHTASHTTFHSANPFHSFASFHFLPTAFLRCGLLKAVSPPFILGD
jgi:hypothetical protein